jgi:glycosyltransferase involved in cell wall biosynthesis
MNSARKVFRLFSRLNIGGPAIHVVNLSVGLNRFGYETTLIVGSPEPTEGSMEDWARASGAELRVIPSFQAPIHVLRDLSTFFQLLFVFWRSRPSIVHTHTFKAGLLGRLAARLAGVPIVVHTYHGHLLSGYWSKTKSQILGNVERILNRLSTQVIAVSRKVADDLITAKIVKPDKIEVIELGFDIREIENQLEVRPSLKADLGLGDDDELVGIVGRLVPVKAVDLFIRALAPLLERRPNLHLAIVGDGSEASQLQALSSSLSSGRIHFCGWRRPVIHDLRDLDLCVCSSRNEGTSVSIIECVVAGVPVVCTNVGGMSDLLGGGKWGELVEFDEAVLCDRVEKMLGTLAKGSDDVEKIALMSRTKAASDFFKHRFSVDRLLSDMDRLYRRLSNQTIKKTNRVSWKANHA